MMKRSWVGGLLVALIGCGNPIMFGPVDDEADQPSEATVGQVVPDSEFIEGPEGPRGLTGRRGATGDSALLSWGLFGGISPVAVLAAGGPIDVLSFTQLDEGLYEIEYDLPTSRTEALVAVLAGGTNIQTSSGNLLVLVSAQLEFGHDNLTVRVASVATLIDPRNTIQLASIDAGVFSVVVYGGDPRVQDVELVDLAPSEPEPIYVEPEFVHGDIFSFLSVDETEIFRRLATAAREEIARQIAGENANSQCNVGCQAQACSRSARGRRDMMRSSFDILREMFGASPYAVLTSSEISEVDRWNESEYPDYPCP